MSGVPTGPGGMPPFGPGLMGAAPGFGPGMAGPFGPFGGPVFGGAPTGPVAPFAGGGKPATASRLPPIFGGLTG